MPDSVLGIDTSNYTTSAALLCNGEIVNRKKLLPVRQGERGLRPVSYTHLDVYKRQGYF